MQLLAVLGALTGIVMMVAPLFGYLGEGGTMFLGLAVFAVSVILGARLNLWPIPEVPKDFQ
ncbi:hypothetical protein HQ571_04385 [Candidatus Kuenenbacteria bacterium]|nr:hypothetical protein [Candidatus Kuenenbacteria bacterium]